MRLTVSTRVDERKGFIDILRCKIGVVTTTAPPIVLNTFADRVAQFHLVTPDDFHPSGSAMLHGPTSVRIVVDEEVSR